MADVKRVVSISFWNDRKVCDEFSPEDKYFFLYLLTNPHTTQLGIYELPISKASEELGYSKESVKVLLDRFENKYKVIKYSHLTGEIAIRFFLKHSIVKGGKPVEDCLKKEYANVKDKDLVKYIYESLSIKNNLNETVVKFLNNIKVDLSNISINDNDNENDQRNDDKVH